jgi:hypothetical protein
VRIYSTRDHGVYEGKFPRKKFPGQPGPLGRCSEGGLVSKFALGNWLSEMLSTEKMMIMNTGLANDGCRRPLSLVVNL